MTEEELAKHDSKTLLQLLLSADARCDDLTAERDRLREALAFYADEENYKWYSAVDPCGCCSSWYEPKIHINGDDSGQIARAALKGEGHE